MSEPSGPLKIAVVGIEPNNVHFRTYVRYLLERGHDVTVVTNTWSAEEAARVVNFARHTRLIRLAPRWFRDLLRAIRLRGALRAERFDVVSVQQMTPDGVFAALLAPWPVVPTFWGSDILRLSIRPWYVRCLMPKAVARAARVHATSGQIAQILTSMGAHPDRVETFNYGVDLDVFALDGPEAREGSRVVCTRGLRPFYRAEAIVRALPLLARRVPDVRLVLAGDGQPGDREALERVAAECGVADRVEFPGRLAPAGVAAELRRAAVFVSIPPTDSFALSVQEAMACGAFPVVSDIPSMREALDERTAAFVTDVSPEPLAAALADAIERVRQGSHIAPNRATVERVGDRRQNLARFERMLIEAARRAAPGAASASPTSDNGTATR